MKRQLIGCLLGLIVAAAPAVSWATFVKECSSVNDPGYVFLCSYDAGEDLNVFYEVSMSPQPCYADGPGVLVIVDQPQTGPAKPIGGGWEPCMENGSFVYGTFETWGRAYASQHSMGGEIYARIQNNTWGGCCSADDDSEGKVSTANISVVCQTDHNKPLPSSIPVEMQVTRANFSTAAGTFEYKTEDPVKLLFVTRLDFYSWYRVKVQHYSLPLSIEPFQVIELGPSGQYPAADATWIDPKKVEYDTTNDVLTVIQTYHLNPGKYLFRIGWDWFEGRLPPCKPPEGGAAPPAVLGSWKITYTPGLKLEDAPGNFPASAPGLLIDPMNPFDVLHFRLTADSSLTSPVAIKSIDVALDAAGDELSMIQQAILYADPQCSGGAGATLAQDTTPANGATFDLQNETIAPGESKCYTVSLVPKTTLASQGCPCADIRAAVEATDVSATANSVPVQVQGNLVTSSVTLGPQGLVANGPTSLESFPFKKSPVSVRLNPGLCPTKWDAEFTVIQAPKGAKGYGFVNPADGAVMDGLYVAFPATGPAVVEVPFRAGDHAGTYRIQVRAVSDLCSQNLTLAAPVVFEVQAKPAPIVVNSTGMDGEPWADDGVCFTGKMLDDDTPECTLLAAIMEANNRPGPDTIAFDLPPVALDPKISVTEWPEIPLQCPAVIDGTTQPGGGYVILDGSALSSGENGLVLTGSGCTIQGLVILGFPGSGIVSDADVHLKDVRSRENGGNGVRASGDIQVDGAENHFSANGSKASTPIEAHGLYTTEGHVFLVNTTVYSNAGWGVVQGQAPVLASGSSFHGSDISENGKGGSFWPSRSRCRAVISRGTWAPAWSPPEWRPTAPVSTTTGDGAWKRSAAGCNSSAPIS